MWEISTCEIIDCKSVPDITMATVTLTEDGNTRYGAVAYVACENGYNNSLEIIRCLETGSWEIPICEKIDCGELENPTNGAVNISKGTTFGVTASYSCDVGFNLVGDETRNCGPSGKWSNMKPDCAQEGDKKCSEDTDSRGTVWNEIAAGKTRIYDCKTNFTGSKMRHCDTDGTWAFPKYECIRETVKNAVSQSNLLNENATQLDVRNVLQDLKGVTSQDESIEEGDKLTDLEITSLVTSSVRIAELLSSSPDSLNADITNDFTEYISNLLDPTNIESWNAISQTSSSVAESVLSSIDTLGEALGKYVASSGTALPPVVKKNIAVQVKQISSDEFVFPGSDAKHDTVDGSWLVDTKSKVQFNLDSLQGKTDQEFIVTAAMYKDLSDILPDKSEDEKLNGQIVAFSTWPPVSGEINPPVTITFEQTNTELTEPNCTFWKFESGSTGYWSSEGCSVKSRNNGSTECECNHTTNFAVILSLQGDLLSVPFFCILCRFLIYFGRQWRDKVREHLRDLNYSSNNGFASVLPMHKYTVLYNLRMGEHVGHDTVSSVLKTVFNNGSLLFDTGMIFRNTSYYIFRDSDNILCNLTSNDNCDPATTDCQQQNGTTFCKCKDGYKKLNPSEKFCIDIDECVETHMTCSGHGKCKNTREGYTCVCTEGYIMNRTDPYNVSCNDIDECNSREYTCKNGSCSNTDGNWNCICPSLGFWRNEFSKNVVVCEDINECSNSSYFCGGECNNTFGSWTCDCGTGYQSHPNKTKYASNITCDDIDECAENKTDCSGHGNCRNMLGDYTCDCDTGFIFNETNKSCQDIDECSSSSYFCGGKCNNTFGSWACDCGTGYQSHTNKTKYASNITCEDIDECTENKIDCSGHGNCTNVPGGYMCVCDTGFIFNETNKSCEDIDECQSPNYTCGGGGNCSNTDGNWTCSCPAFGYRPHEYSEKAIVCEDIDECSDSTYYCGGTCNNTLGNWTCECDTGYTRESNEEETIITCEDINECDNKESCIDGVCRNQDGSWTCKCPDGKEPKTINSTTILCSGGYVYIATIGIAVTGHVGNKDPELKVYLETQIKTAYESKYPEHNVRVEIISISKGSTDRKKRQTSENLAVEFVLHFDEPLESENITNAWQDYRKESCPKGICKAEKNDIAVELPFNVIFEEDVVFEEDKQTDGLCKIPQNNLCNPDSTKCQYINATLNCECKKGYTRKSDYECKVSKNTCNENPCQNDGSCHMINADTDFECRCRDGWTGKTCEDVQKIIVKSAETESW
ncbi:fibrillin-2-like [Mercenaria mercenaria]|uniref:fibrillin-2-like n=1 Tax=Mercenaria mercenaria TaxID=6596 RepID=UPI00234F4B4C|nr:fibrillin-2-like [Mercenaria mercenaria]